MSWPRQIRLMPLVTDWAGPRRAVITLFHGTMCAVADDWFRTPAWDDAARLDFEARLRRSRIHTRPQYLRIKAIALSDAGEMEGAKQLLERVLDEPGPYPDQELPIAHELLGDLARATSDWVEAERHYRHILQTWPDMHSTTGAIEVSLADVLSRHEDAAARAEALSLLQAYMAREDRIPWPVTLFEWHLVRIRLARRDGDVAALRASAREAIDLAGAESPFPRHPGAGAVSTTSDLVAELEQLAQATD